MKDEQAIIIDIDNTIIDQNTRKAYILQDILGRRDISSIEINKDFALKSIMKKLTHEEQEKFWAEFLSPRHYKGSKGLIIKCYEGCSYALNQMSKKFRIIYVTARPDVDGQKEELLTQLSESNLPMPSTGTNELYLMPLKELPLSHEDFTEKAKKYKLKLIKKLASSHNIFVGIGDTKEDIIAFKSVNIIAIQFSYPSFKQRQFIESDLYFSKWQDIKNAVNLLTDKSNPLAELQQLHIKEYGEWLGDLDSKSRFLLIIDTALFATATSILIRETAFPSSLLFLISIISSIIAMIFCIRSFSSRRIRGIKGGITISLAGRTLTNLWRCLIGYKPIPPGSPIEESEIVRNAKNSRKKVSHIQFFMNNYGTLDPETVMNLRLYELRALNYIKIYGEQWGRRFTFLSIISIFFGILFKCFN